MLYLSSHTTTPVSSDRDAGQRMLLEELNQLSMDFEHHTSSSFDTEGGTGTGASSFTDSCEQLDSTDSLALEFDADAFDISPSCSSSSPCTSPSSSSHSPYHQFHQVTRHGDRIPLGTDIPTCTLPTPHAAMTAAAVTASFIVYRSNSPLLNVNGVDSDIVQKRPRSPSLSTGQYDDADHDNNQFLKNDANDSDDDDDIEDDDVNSLKQEQQLEKHSAHGDDEDDGQDHEQGHGQGDEGDSDCLMDDDDDDVTVHVEPNVSNKRGKQKDKERKRKSRQLDQQHTYEPSHYKTTTLTNDPVSPRSVTIPVSTHSSPSKSAIKPRPRKFQSRLLSVATALSPSVSTSSTITTSTTDHEQRRSLKTKEKENDKETASSTTTTHTAYSCASDTMSASLKDYEDENENEEDEEMVGIQEVPKLKLKVKQNNNEQQVFVRNKLPSVPRPSTIVHPSTVPAVITNALACAKDPNSCRQRRAEAMERFRRKKAVRCYGRRVRYQIRKRIATTRPRVNGRFAKRSDLEALIQKKSEKSD